MAQRAGLNVCKHADWPCFLFSQRTPLTRFHVRLRLLAIVPARTIHLRGAPATRAGPPVRDVFCAGFLEGIMSSDKGRSGSDNASGSKDSSDSSGSKSSSSGGFWVGADAVRSAVDTASGMLGDRNGSNSDSDDKK